MGVVLTHKGLVRRAAQWLKNARRCRVILEEIVTLAGEQPDVIGWKAGSSILVEVKMSRGDFHRDKKKYSRQEGNGLGNKRWYCCPLGVLTPEDMPPGWGLVVSEGKSMRILKDATWHPLSERAHIDEKYLLMSATWRSASGVRVKPIFFPKRSGPSVADEVTDPLEDDMALSIEELKKEPNLLEAARQVMEEEKRAATPAGDGGRIVYSGRALVGEQEKKTWSQQLADRDREALFALNQSASEDPNYVVVYPSSGQGEGGANAESPKGLADQGE
jgi:hypothetical protein